MIQNANYKLCFVPVTPQDLEVAPPIPKESLEPTLTAENYEGLQIRKLKNVAFKVAQYVVKFLGIIALISSLYVLNTYMLLPRVIIDDTIRLFFLFAMSLALENALDRRTKVRVNGYSVEI